MPRIKNPGTIRTGSGQTLPTVADNLMLTGGGLPNIGQPGYSLSGFGTFHAGLPPDGGAGGGSDLMAHVNDPVNAHAATAISHDNYSDLFYSNNVGGSLDELVSVLPPRPPMMGESAAFTTFSGIPDWGVAKLQDVNLQQSIGDGLQVYPYYWTAPSPTTDWVGTPYEGCDPSTDPIWNGRTYNGLTNIPGTGLGWAKAGGFTDGAGAVNRTRGLPLQDDGGGPYVLPVTVSGMVFPADRGVVAILHWPKENTKADFLAQNVLDRCVAAIVLGSGLATSGGSGGVCGVDSCDGAPGSSGSLFAIGLNADGSYNPLAYPGRASGQYNLREISEGSSSIDGSPLEHPWDIGWVRAWNGIAIGPGQVRLGTEPAAGIPSLPYGIPILGAGPHTYSPATHFLTKTVLLNGAPVTPLYCGESLIVDTNFFAYRLPYLKDYSRATGLPYTPHGIDPNTTRETARYFGLGASGDFDATAAAGRVTTTVPPYLLQAGNYDNFPEDYWAWQIARYRHSFYVPGSEVSGVDLGSYWMVHFKREADFEACVRDGIMPWDGTAPYEVYGASLLDTAADNVASDKNLVNPLDSLIVGAPFGTPFAPGKGPSPDYGYSSRSYHVLRSSMVVGDTTLVPNPITHTFTWDWNNTADFRVTVISGVSYFVPRNAVASWGFKLTDMALDVRDVWVDFFRTEDNPLTGEVTPIAPARLSAPCPLFIGVAPFAFENVLVAGGSHIADAVFGHQAPRLQRLEVPFQYCGPYSDAVGPAGGDSMLVSSLGTGVTFPGDMDLPSFTADASLVAFIRRPLLANPIQPVTATDGNGIRLVQTNNAGAKILYHSTKWNEAQTHGGHYGNFGVGVGGPCDSHLMTALKDTEERFLDETYKYRTHFWAFSIPDVQIALQGPGMQGWAGGPITVPVQAGTTADSFMGGAWLDVSGYQSGDYFGPVPSQNLQVAGLPYRNPRIQSNDGCVYPFPSAGLLQYPKTNYSVGYVPNLADQGANQPDYSAVTGTRYYTRCFDASFARFAADPTTPSVPSVAGQPLAVVRIDGLHLEDFQYVAAGPGGLGDGLDDTRYTGIAIQVKVPGLTTWMDLGRVDGSGPSKQDPARDGAGCKVIGPHTFDGNDQTTGIPYCQVEFNVGPWANFAQGVETTGGSGIYEVPVVVRVGMNELAKDYDLTLQYDMFPGQFIPGVKPGLQGAYTRGLCGIKIVHPTQVQTAP